MVFKTCCAHLHLTCQYAVAQCVWGQEHLPEFWGWYMCHIHPSTPKRQQDKGSQMPPESRAASHMNWTLEWGGSEGNRQWVLNTCSTSKTLSSYKVSFSHGSRESCRISMVPRWSWCPWRILSIFLLFEYEPAGYCSSWRASACQHPDYEMKDLKMLNPTLTWIHDGSYMPADT